MAVFERRLLAWARWSCQHMSRHVTADVSSVMAVVACAASAATAAAAAVPVAASSNGCETSSCSRLTPRFQLFVFHHVPCPLRSVTTAAKCARGAHARCSHHQNNRLAPGLFVSLLPYVLPLLAWPCLLGLARLSLVLGVTRVARAVLIPAHSRVPFAFFSLWLLFDICGVAGAFGEYSRCHARMFVCHFWRFCGLELRHPFRFPK